MILIKLGATKRENEKETYWTDPSAKKSAVLFGGLNAYVHTVIGSSLGSLQITRVAGMFHNLNGFDKFHQNLFGKI